MPIHNHSESTPAPDQNDPQRARARAEADDLMQRLWARNDMLEDEAMELAIEAQEEYRKEARLKSPPNE